MTYLPIIYQAIVCFENLKDAWRKRINELKTQAEKFGGTGLFGGSYHGPYAAQVKERERLADVRIFLELLAFCC